MSEARTTPIRRVARASFAVTAAPWPFAQQRRAEIDAHFAALRRDKPALWNGRVMLFRDCRFEDDGLTGTAFETDYASFLAWQAWARPDREIQNCFALPALAGSDGGFLLGRMASHTANAGQVYFPCGTPDPNDIVAGHVDFDVSVRRELLEETGLGADLFETAPDWRVVCQGEMIALFKPMRAREPAPTLRERIMDFLSTQDRPELSDILIVRTVADLTPAMPAYVAAFLGAALSSKVTE